MKLIHGLLIKTRIIKARPHEKDKLGKGVWGRQETKAEPIATISARVIRKDGTVEDLGIISGGKK